MKILPVLDLLNGVVVHGIKGERDRYQPVKSILSTTADPLTVAHALHMETSCHALYIADLDAIQGVGDNITSIKEIASQLDVDLWIDAGTATPAPIEQLFAIGANAVIIGSETLETMQQLKTICSTFPTEKLLFSIDIIKGLVRSRTKELHDIHPLEALSILTEQGLDRFIILTLDAVGTTGGPDLPLIEMVKNQFPSATIIAGGGVKTPSHLNALKLIDTDGVLIATSLHRGWIRKQDLARWTSV